MAVPESGGSDANPGLFASLRSFWSVLLAILYTRLDLVTFELEGEARRVARFLMVGLSAVLCIFMTVFFLLFFLVVTFWDERVLILSIVCAVSVVGSLILVLVARKMVLEWPRFLAQTLTELRRDVESVRAAAKSGEVPRS